MIVSLVVLAFKLTAPSTTSHTRNFKFKFVVVVRVLQLNCSKSLQVKVVLLDSHWQAPSQRKAGTIVRPLAVLLLYNMY